MKKLAFLILMFSIGCAHSPELVTARYKPKKMGVVSVPDTWKPAYVRQNQRDATAIMRNFCAPLAPDVVEVSKDSKLAGSTTNQVFGTSFTTADYKDSQLITFECVEGPEKPFFALQPEGIDTP